MPQPNTVELDPWSDEFTRVDFNRHRDELADDLVDVDPDPELPPPPPPAPEPVPAEPEAEEDEPFVFTLADGGSVTIEKTKSKGWKGVADLGDGSPQQVFYGKTKNEMIQNALIAQVNATRKIREQNRTIKLGITTETPTAPKPHTPPAEKKELTADEITQIKLEMESNPDLALSKWFQAKTGMDMSELVRLAREGQQAKADLHMESVARQFVTKNPDYYADPKNENYTAIVAYLAKHKMGRNLTDRNQEATIAALAREGHWTVQNLDEAYGELQESGLLVLAPRRAPEPPTPQPAPPAPAPERSPERIVRTETRPRAGLGIRSTEATPAPVEPEAPKPLTAEDYDSMTDAQIAAEMQRFRKEALASRRR